MTQDELQVVLSAKINPLMKDLDKVKKSMSGLDKQTGQMNESIQKGFNKSIASVSKKTAAIAALSVVAAKTAKQVGTLGTQAIALDSQMNSLGRTMGSSTNEFLKWGRTTATQFGISERAAIQFGGQFSSIVARSADSTKDVKEMTQELLKAGAIVSANVSQFGIDEVMERMRSGMSGRNEAIEDLGIEVKPNVIKSTQAYALAVQQTGRAWEQMTERQQANVRLQAISEQAFNRYGTTLQRNAQQVAVLRAQIDNMQLAWSRAFAPIVQFVIPVLQTLVGWLQTAALWTRAFLELFFGVEDTTKKANTNTKQISTSMGSAADAVGNMGSGMKKANKEAQKLQRTLFGFDVIHNIDEPLGAVADLGGGGGGGIGPAPDFDLGDLDTGIGLVQNISDELARARETLAKFRDSIVNGAKALAKNIELIIGTLLGATLLGLVTKGLADWGKAIIEFRSKNPLRGIFGPLGPAFANAAHNATTAFTGSFASIDMDTFNPFARMFSNAAPFSRALYNVDMFFWTPLLSKAEKMTGSIFSKIGRIIPINTAHIARLMNETFTGNVVKGIGGVVGGISKALMGTQGLILEVGAGLFDGLFTVAGGFFDGGLRAVLGFVEGTTGALAAEGPMWLNLLTAPFAGLQGALAPIMEGFASILAIPGVPIALLVAAIAGISAAVVHLGRTNEEFRGAWIKAWKAIKESVQGVLDFFKPFVVTILGYFLKIYTDGIKPLVDDFVEMVRVVGVKLAEMLQHAMPVVEFFVKVFGGQIVAIATVLIGAISEMVASIARTLGKLLSNVGQVLGGVIDFFTGFIQFIKGVFTGDFTGAMNGIKKMFDGVWNGMLGTVKFVWNTIIGMFKAGGSIFKGFVGSVADVFKTVVNGLIRGINNVISAPFRALNASFAKFRNISIMGAKPFGWLPNIGIPSIPAFATGGFPEDGLFFANSNELVGKFTNGKTAVANNAQIVEGVSAGVANAVSQVLAGQTGGNGSPINLTVQIGSKTIAKETIDAVDEYTRRTGYTFKTV